MKIVYKKPWFWWIIRIVSPNAKWGFVTLAFGDTIYTHRVLSRAEIAHEEAHGRQDRHSKFFAFINAIRCHIDKKYYLRCEIEGYQAQNMIMPNPQMYARNLSSSLYNNIISYEDALKHFI